MVFYKHQGTKWKKITCSKCQKDIEVGEVFYSKATKRRIAKNSVTHICEKCYEKQFVTV